MNITNITQEKISVTSIIKENYPGKKIQLNHKKQAGRILKSKGVDAAKDYLKDKVSDFEFNFKAPAKCNIVYQSRDYAEWPIVKASEEIQKYIYNLSKDERDKSEPGLSKESHNNWFKITGVNNHGYCSVQGLSLIFQHAFSIYDGVKLKVDNRNKKKKEIVDRKNKFNLDNGYPKISFEAETAFDEHGKLIQLPGINFVIYAYQQVSPKAFLPSKHEKLVIPDEYKIYKLEPNISNGFKVIKNRLDYLHGCPGHIPNHQRGQDDKKCGECIERKDKKISFKNLSIKKNKRMKGSKELKKSLGLLVILKIESDFILIDARGLLRNARWRGLAPESLTLNNLLNLFTGDPVINTKDRTVSFMYKAESIQIHSNKINIGAKKANQQLKKLTATEQIALISVDLGQTNPIAAAIYKFSNKNEDLESNKISSLELPIEEKENISRYRNKYSEFTSYIQEESVKLLSKDQQFEITNNNLLPKNNSNNIEPVKQKICNQFKIDPNQIKWKNMTKYSTYISDCIIDTYGDCNDVWVDSEKSIKIKKKDIKWKVEFSPKLSDETRKAWNEVKWDLQRTAPEYKKFEKYKKELARRCANFIVKESYRLSQCNTCYVVLENLNRKNNKFSGSGFREDGWDNFFINKKENRWFIDAFHNAFSELAEHRGMNFKTNKHIYVSLVEPYNTSRTCPSCRHCDANNRNGEQFKCTKCGALFHADFEVATYNLMEIVRTGVPLPVEKRERLGAAKKAVTARKRQKTSEPKEKIISSLDETTLHVVNESIQKERLSQSDV